MIQKGLTLKLEQVGGVQSRSRPLEPFMHGGGAVQQRNQCRRPQKSWAVEISIYGPYLD